MKGSKTERRPGVWRFRVFTGRDPVTGAPIYASKTFHGTDRQSETALAKFVTECAEGAGGDGSKLTVAGLLEAYCDHAAGIGRSPTTVAEYRRLSGNLKDGIGRTRLSKLKPEDVNDLYRALSARGVPGGRGGLSPASVNRYHDLLKTACRHAVKMGWRVDNPIDRATPPSEPRAKVSSPSPAELRVLIAGAAKVKTGHGVFVALAATTGARRGELAALRWSDVDLDVGVVHFRRGLKQVGRQLFVGDTKTHQGRTVALPAASVELLRGFRLQADARAARTAVALVADPFVFSPKHDHSRPYMPDNLSQMFRRVADAAGLPYHLHQLRHFAATQGFAAGFDPVTVAARLGHSDPKLTMQTYADALQDRDRAFAESLGAIVAPAALEEGAK